MARSLAVLFFAFIRCVYFACDGVEIKVITKNYNLIGAVYTNHQASRLNQFFFKARLSKNGFVGLTSEKFATFRNKRLYEIVIGPKAVARFIGLNATGDLTKNTSAPFTLAGGNKAFYNPDSTVSYWLSWTGAKIDFGFGDVVGQQMILSANISHVGYDIRHIGFATSQGATDSFWYFNDAEPLYDLELNCSFPGKLVKFELKPLDRETLNDNNTSTCMEVTSQSVRSFLSLSFHGEPPLQIGMVMKNAPSCEQSNLVVFDAGMNECQATQPTSTSANGLSECHWMCNSECTSVATIKFEKAYFGPQQWSICEIYEARNRYPSI